jgi:hypothetical protein
VFFTTFLKRASYVCWLAVAWSAIALAQTDRGIITGTVMDPGGAVVANASITVTNTRTGGVYDTRTTSAGDYTVPLLPPGVYTVTVEAPGFEKYVGTGTEVTVNNVSRVDVKLTVGAVSQSVTVDATAPLLKSESDEQSTNVNTQEILQLPNEGTGGARNPRAMVILVPGVSGQGEGTSGRVNGQTPNTQRLYIDGQDISSANSNGSNTGPPPQEMVQEFALQTSNFAAEYGAVQGGAYVFATKSGTNQLHGSLFEYWQNNLLDADKPFVNTNPFDRKNDFGFSISGPIIIPKIYNGKNKTFFFVVFEDAKNGLSASGATNTVPTLLYRQGNFSQALTGRQLNGTDPLGNPYYENTIYDPATTMTSASGVQYRMPFPGNIIPMSRLDPVALKIQAFIPLPDVPGATVLNNWYQSPKYGTYSVQPAFKVDHYISDRQKLSIYIDRPFNLAPNNEDGLPLPITTLQLPHGSTWIPRLNYDYTISPTVLLHWGAGFLRFYSPDTALPQEFSYNAAQQLGFTGSAIGTGFPVLSIPTSSTGGGMGPTMGPTQGDQSYYDKVDSVAGLTWVHGSHTYKFGGEWANNEFADVNLTGTTGNLNFSPNETGDPSTQGQSLGGAGVGMAYASFLLGLVDNATVKPPQELEYRDNRGAWYIQDSWKVNHRFTLDYGLRWDIQAQGHEIFNRSSMFGPTIPNPSAGGLLGGTVYEGYGAGRCNCYFDHPYPWAFGPRLGFAYQVAPKTVLRGGWGVVYTAIPYFNNFTQTPVQGVGINQLTFNAPAFGVPTTTLSQGLQYAPSALTTANYLNPGIDPAPGGVNSPIYFIDPNADRPGRIHTFSVNLQQQLTKDLLVEAAYVGNRGVWESGPSGLVALNAISQQDLAAHGLSLSIPADVSLLTSTLSSTAAKAAGFTAPYPGFPLSQTVAQSIRPYPQFNSNFNPMWAPLGNNWYDSLQAKVTKRYSYGLIAQAAYTFSKEEATGQAVNDVFNRPNQKSLVSSSQPNLFTLSFVYEVPLQKLPGGHQWLVRHIVSGWQLSALLRYSSGLPIPVPASQGNLNSLIFQSTRMNRVPGQPLYLVNLNCGCYNPYNTLVLNPKAWQDVPNGQWGYSAPYYNDYRYGRVPSEQAGLARTFRPTEHVRLQVRVEFYNVFNRIIYGGNNPSSSNPLATVTTNSLGQYTGGFGFQNPTGFGGERTGQAVFRVDF